MVLLTKEGSGDFPVYHKLENNCFTTHFTIVLPHTSQFFNHTLNNCLLPPCENTLYDGQSLDAGEDIIHDAQGGGASNM